MGVGPERRATAKGRVGRLLHFDPPPGAAPADTIDVTRADPNGLTSAEAEHRLAVHGANRLRDDSGNHPLAVLFRQFRSPMVLILLGAAILSFFLGEYDEASIVLFIVLASTGLGFYQEYRAGNAVAELRRRIAVTCTVLRDGAPTTEPAATLVPGDVLVLSAGSLIPADGVVLAATALHIDEAVLTGESFPVLKASTAPDNRAHMGTSVRSGEGRVLVTATGRDTEFGGLAEAVGALDAETSFARGTRRFGLLMTQIMLVLVTVVLVANVLLGRPVLDSLLFAAALAVGITPELLPAIVTVTLSQGAKRLTERGVLVRRLVAIENLGSMDMLCTDKTGTLTIGEVRLDRAVDAAGTASGHTLRLAMLNAALQTAMANPLDSAILARRGDVDIAAARKLGEVPYDFERKRLSVLVADDDGPTLICKGAVGPMLDCCTAIEIGGVAAPLTAEHRADAESRLAEWSGDGFRVIAIATRELSSGTCSADDEAGLTLVGYLVFSDPLKPGIVDTVAALARNGIELRVISGDNRYVAAHVATEIGLKPRIVTGAQIETLHGAALARFIRGANVFAEVTPDIKERIIAALRHTGATVGYMGDGINDAPALRAADIGISVDNAVDAAKATADVILLRQDLNVLLEGVLAGRTAFGNTIKYIAITISANFGNMISMAVASLVLPFLPMLATQILLNNLLSDLPMLAISTDRVDAETLERPRQWDFRALIRAMVGFGLMSSIFDGLTFLLLLVVFHADAATFQTGWFVESLLTELCIVAVMRTHKSFFRSAPSALLLWTSAGVALVTVASCYLPYAKFFAFAPLSPALMASLLAIVIVYVAASEVLKTRLGLIGPRSIPPARGRARPALWWRQSRVPR